MLLNNATTVLSNWPNCIRTSPAVNMILIFFSNTSARKSRLFHPKVTAFNARSLAPLPELRELPLRRSNVETDFNRLTLSLALEPSARSSDRVLIDEGG